MLLVMLYLVTFDDFGLIHQTKRVLKSNRTNLHLGKPYFFVLCCLVRRSSVQFKYGTSCPCKNPEGLLAIYSTSKSEEKISIIL